MQKGLPKLPTRGGAAAKLGDRYENIWTVLQLFRLLDSAALSITLEPVGVNEAEFILCTSNRREYHQLKRSNPNGKWSIHALSSGDTKLLQGIGRILNSPDTEFHFVSGSDAPELRELTERARTSQSPEEFHASHLSLTLKKSYKAVAQTWATEDCAVIWDKLRRILVKTADENSLRHQVDSSITAHFLADVPTVMASLRGLILDSVQKTLDRAALMSHLSEHGFPLRTLRNRGDAATAIENVTKKYLKDTKAKLIGRELIPRQYSAQVVKEILGSSGAIDCIICGNAGTGKTGCVVDIVERLLKERLPVLAFRLDRLGNTARSKELGEQLELEESPALVIGAVAGECPAVLVLDQLDTLSSTSGRGLELFDAVEAILEEVHGLRSSRKIHIVLVCRLFDWQNDHRLRGLLQDEHHQVEIGEFSEDELKLVLAQCGQVVAPPSAPQLKLLRLPQNLSLYLELRNSRDAISDFTTQKDLFDLYWKTKRHAVSLRSRCPDSEWPKVIALLIDHMNANRELSVPKEKLDDANQVFVNAMASEGVITETNHRYGLGHESFFDYCYARNFARSNELLCDALQRSEQHLFRRSQVRQVLIYLRDSDAIRYKNEFQALLLNGNIRFHIKALVIALLTSMPHPLPEETDFVISHVNGRMDDIANHESTCTDVTLTIWRSFWQSRKYFELISEKGILEQWLKSDRDEVINCAIRYLRGHSHEYSEKVAEVLSKYVGASEKWDERLRQLMEWADLSRSREYFDLFLELLSHGALDTARTPIAINGTFWNLLYPLKKAHPEWIAEVLATWLRRRRAILESECEAGPPRWEQLFGNDENDGFAAEAILHSARANPKQFVEELLTLVLDISESATYSSNAEPPLGDVVWRVFIVTEHPSMSDATLEGLKIALQLLATDVPTELDAFITELRARNTRVANFLLLSLFAASSGKYSDEGASLLLTDDWRLQCGYHDSPFWVTRMAISTIARNCSIERRDALQRHIAQYTNERERRTRGMRGFCALELLAGFPEELMLSDVRLRYLELRRKFGDPSGEPRSIVVQRADSPMGSKGFSKMTDKQWEKAILKYNSDEPIYSEVARRFVWARELASSLEAQAKITPTRFANFLLYLPVSVNPVYVQAVLNGIRGEALPDDDKARVLRRCYEHFSISCGREIVDLIGSFSGKLPDDIWIMLFSLSMNHPDPAEERWKKNGALRERYYDEIYTEGINSTRGRAALAIARLLESDGVALGCVTSQLDALVTDTNIAVRSCVGAIVLAVSQSDEALAVEYLLKLANSDERVCVTPMVQACFSALLPNGYLQLRAVFARMLRSEHAKVAESGASLVALSVLYGHPARDLVDEAMLGTSVQRLGIASVAARNLELDDCREWCIDILRPLFDDEDNTVCERAAGCFKYVDGISPGELENLVHEFLASKAFFQEPHALIHAMENSREKLPGIICRMCDEYVSQHAAESSNMGSRRYGDGESIGKLIIRVYAQHLRDDWGSKALDVIDRMCIAGMAEARNELQEFER